GPRGHPVDARKVRSLVPVTVQAREGQVAGCVGAAVLFGDDVLDLERDLHVLRRQPAVLATEPGPLADGFGGRLIHDRGPTGSSCGGAVARGPGGWSRASSTASSCPAPGVRRGRWSLPGCS